MHSSTDRAVAFLKNSALAVFLGTALPASAALESVELSEGWEFAKAPDVAAHSPKWLPAVVPGTVLTSYWKAGVVEDPEFDDNIAKIDQKPMNVDHVYRTRFRVPEKLRGGRLWLDFDGINWRAEVSLNGKPLGRIDGAFIRGRFDVTDVVRTTGDNDLEVKIIWCEGRVTDMPSFLCTMSWDFMPAIPGRDIGIYKSVRLVKTGDVTLRDACAATDLPLPDVSRADATPRVVARNAGAAKRTGKIRGVIRRSVGTGPKYAFEKSVALEPGDEKEIVFDPVRMTKPDLWWPVGVGHGRGDRPLYRLALAYEENGVRSDAASCLFGVREYSYEFTPGEGKKGKGDLKVSVNGLRVLCVGGNWAVPDNLLSWKKCDFDIAVEMHRDMGFNMIRTWHGAADFDDFYAACDRCGVMVYEDFWLNGWEVPKDREMFVANLADKVRRLRSHPSIAIWCGENEASPPGWCADEIPAAVAKDPEKRLYVPSSNSGVVSGGITYSIQDPGWFYMQAEKFCTEVGAITLPTFRSMQRMMRPENLSMKEIGNKTWDLRGWNFGVGNKQCGTYRRVIGTRYGEPKGDFERFCDFVQYVNYESYKYPFEAWNAKMYDPATGILLWMSNPTWGTVLWQVYDAYKAPTGGYWGAKSACEDLHVQWSPLSGDVQAINHTSRAVAGTVSAKIYDVDGTVLRTFSKKISANANAATTVANFLGTDGGVNVAKGCSAKGSGKKGETDGSKATDGDYATRWSSKDGNDALEVDLGSVRSVDHALVSWENAFASAYDIELSEDGSNWRCVAKVDHADGGNDLLPFEPAKARYARLKMRGSGTMWAPSVYEFKLIEAGSLGGRVPGKGSVAFIALEWRGTKGEMLSRNFYWTGRSGTDYTEIAKMQKVDVDIKVRRGATDPLGKAAHGQGAASLRDDAKSKSSTVSVALENKDKTCAVGLWLELLKADAKSGEEARVLPAWWTENCVSLAPGEKRVVEVSFDELDAAGRPLAVECHGLNVELSLNEVK